MAIRNIVTGGYGNGTFNGTIALVVLMGYSPAPIAPGRVRSDVVTAGMVVVGIVDAGRVTADVGLAGSVVTTIEGG